MMRKLALAAGIVFFATATTALAHDDQSLDSQDPTQGQVTPAVAIQRLRLAGVRNPRVLNQSGFKLYLVGSVQGRETQFELDTLTGEAVEVSQERTLLIGPKGRLSTPTVRGRQLPVERSRLSDPALMRGVARPNR